MRREVGWGLGFAGLSVGYFLGQGVGPAPVEFPDPAEARDALTMERAVGEALVEPRAFVRLDSLVRLFEGLTVENAGGAARAISEGGGRWDPIDLQAFVAAWVLVDPVAAVRTIEEWPFEFRRELGLRLAIREWAASGDWLAATNYVQNSMAPELRSIVAGPLVRGWALGGDADGALGLARTLWDSADQTDVVDGYLRGVLHVGGPEAMLVVARSQDPTEAFGQRIVRATLSLTARDAPEQAARFYEEFTEQGAPVWLDGILERVVVAWRNEDPQASLEWLLAHEPGPGRDRFLTTTTADWGIRDLDSAWGWFSTRRVESSQTGELARDDALMLLGLLPKLARVRSAEAAVWVDRLEPSIDQRQMQARVAKFWSRTDPESASRWIEGLDVGPPQLARLREIHRVESKGAPTS